MVAFILSINYVMLARMHCYLCKSSDLEVVRTKLRGDINRNVLRCKNCSLTYLAPKEANTQEFYRTVYRDTYSPTVGRKLSSKEIFDMYLPFQQARVDRIHHILRPDMRVLDIGASAGHFLHTLKKNVGECIALEFNQSDGEFMQKELGLTVYNTPLEQTSLPTEHFDLITIFQTLEHIEDPISFLTTVHRYLKPEGYLVVEVPNVDEALVTLYHSDAYADFIYKEPHLFYYSPETLMKVLARAGFSGENQTIQRVNFLNHVNWKYSQKPQAGPHIHMAPARLFDGESSPATDELNAWIQKVDEEYRTIINKHRLGESILFIGKKQ